MRIGVPCVALVGAAVLLAPEPGARGLVLADTRRDALRIETIAPACAAAGDDVVITGDGLGARALVVSVGGVPAVVTAVHPRRVHFIVPDGIPLGPTTVVATRASLRSEMPFQLCDLAIPAGWAGRWRITLTYRDATTSDLVAVDHVTTAIRPGEPLGLDALGGVAECSATATDDHSEATCVADLDLDPCRVRATVQVGVDRIGPSLSGSGSAVTSVGGLCPSSSEASVVEVSGVQLDPDPGPAVPGAGGLLPQLVHTAAVRLPRTLAFASFTVGSLRLAPLTFRARGSFHLADGGGIDPVAETVGIRLGAFTTTLPAGSLVPDPHRPNAVRFDGTTADGVKLSVVIRKRPSGTFAFTLRGAGRDLGGTADPLFVSLLIGDDAGTARVRPVLSER